MEEVQNFIRHVVVGLQKLPFDVGLDLFPNPKTDPERCPYGFAVKLPCGLHNGVERYSHFVDENICEVDDVLSHLQAVVPCVLPILPVINDVKTKSKRRPARKGDAVKALKVGAVSAPPMTERLSRLFKGCKFLRQFKDRSDLAGYWEWTHSGMVLSSVGDDGASWFEYLSSLDPARYNGSHESVIESVQNRGYKAPTCKSIGCSHCGLRSPLETIGKTRKRYRTEYTGLSDQEETVSLSSLRDEYCQQVRSVIDTGKPGVWLCNFPLGGGKTTMAVEELQKSGAKCLFYCPTHALGQEVKNKFKDSIQVFGRSELSRRTDFVCEHEKEINDGVNLGLSASYYCSAKKGCCAQRHDCAYLKQFESAENAQAVVLVHNHLQLGHKKKEQIFSGRDVLIVDESFASHWREEQTINQKQISCLKSALAWAKADKDIQNMLGRLLTFLDSENKAFQVPEFSLRPEQFGVVDHYFRTKAVGMSNPLPTIFRAGNEQIPLYNNQGKYMAINLPATLPSDIPVLILDATAEVKDYELLLGQSIKQINPAFGKRLARSAKTVQVATGGYTNSSLLANGNITDIGRRVLDFARQRIRDDSDYGVICTKQMESWLLDNNIFPAKNTMHFNALRGLNRFEDIRDLFVIGYHGVSYYDLVRQARIAFNQNWRDTEMAEALGHQHKFLPLNTSGKESCSIQTLSPENEYVRSWYDFSVRAEVEQAIGRARIYNDSGSKDRTVYLVTNIPTSLEIDSVEELPFDEDKDVVLQSAKHLLKTNAFFTRKQLAEQSGRSDRQIRSRIDDIVVDLKLETVKGAHNQLQYCRIA